MKTQRVKIGLIAAGAGVMLLVGLATRTPAVDPPAVTASASQMQMMAEQAFAEGRLREAAFFAAASIVRSPASDSFSLYVKIATARADSSRGAGRYRAAMREASEALKAVESWQRVLIESGADRESVNEALSAEDSVRQTVATLAATVIEEAEGMRSEWRRPWYRRDSRPVMIRALLLLDTLNPAVLSPEDRERHSAAWTDLYRRLGSELREIYKVRSNMQSQ